MKRNLMSLRDKAWFAPAMAAGVLLLASCAQDGYDDDERWTSSVTNTALESPDASDITIEASTDGSKTVISWNVVYGAGGYYCSVYNVSDEDNPVVVDEVENELVDGCSLAVTREEDNNYLFCIRTAGNDELNNTEATTTTEVEFNSFTETYATIPAGSDLAEWFSENPVPTDIDDDTDLCYDLEPGGEYTLSESIDFLNSEVTLRTTSQTEHAKVTFTGTDVSIKTGAGMTIKYIDFDCSTSLEPFIMLSETPDESLLGATGTGDYYNIQSAITVNGCEIEGLNYGFIHDNSVKYCLETLLINNCVVHLTISSTANPDQHAVIYMYTGFANDLTIQNSTFWNSGDSDCKYFVQYSNAGRCSRAGYTQNSVNYLNSTFYKLAYEGQWGNYSAFAGQSSSYWVMTDNIFVDCGSGQVPRRFLAGRTNVTTATFANNTYMYDGEFESTNGSVEYYDDSGTAIEEDPQFADPDNGDFTVGGSAQIEKQTGDPRWLPSEE